MRGGGDEKRGAILFWIPTMADMYVGLGDFVRRVRIHVLTPLLVIEGSQLFDSP